MPTNRFASHLIMSGHPPSLFDVPGFGVLSRRGRDLHWGGMETSGPGSGDLIPGGDVGDLWAPGLTG